MGEPQGLTARIGHRQGDPVAMGDAPQLGRNHLEHAGRVTGRAGALGDRHHRLGRVAQRDRLELLAFT